MRIQRQMKQIIKKYSFLFLLPLLFTYGCSNTRYLPEGEMLYTGGDVTVKDSLQTRKERKEMEGQM